VTATAKTYLSPLPPSRNARLGPPLRQIWAVRGVRYKWLEKLGFYIAKSDFEGRPGDEEHHFWLIAQKRNAP
jgi:hypothetical protein